MATASKDIFKPDGKNAIHDGIEHELGGGNDHDGFSSGRPERSAHAGDSRSCAAAYGQSKTANSLFSVELDRRGKGHGVRAFAVHPGGILTDLVRYLTDDELKAWGIVCEHGVLKAPSSGYKSLAQGAATTMWCSVSPQLGGKGGVYCEDCDIAELVPNDSPALSGVRYWAVDQPTAKALWDLSEQLTGLKWLDAEAGAVPD
jgi:NAD(P)-dependent dehydrogenase (short-subunit alcohol dehydrogenase family)